MADTKNKQKTRDGATKEYKVIGERFKSKEKANSSLEKAFEKGFKNAGLLVQGNEFVILYGTYNTEQIAKANAEAVKKQGFVASIAERKS